MKDKISVAVYMRVGNREQFESNLTEAEQIEKFKEIAKEKGHIYSEKSKEKAWLFIRSKGLMDEETVQLKEALLKCVAEQEGYEIVGKTVIVGDDRQGRAAIYDLLSNETFVNKVDVLIIKNASIIDYEYKDGMELYDALQAKGIKLKTADGSDRIYDKAWQLGRVYRSFLGGDKSESESHENEQAESEEQNESLVPKMGGGE